MRRIGIFSDYLTAKRLCDYLQTQSIDAKTDPDDAGTGGEYPVWIRQERDVDKARDILTQFQLSPNDRRYDVASEAEKIRREREKQTQQQLRQQRKAAERLRGSTSFSGRSAMTGQIPVTIAVIVISTVVSLMTSFARPRAAADANALSLEQRLYVTFSCVDPRDYAATREVPGDLGDPFFSLKRGELWRLITPMFLHGSAMHLVFNMMALYTLGSVVERLHGSLFLAGLLIVSQVAATLTQMSIPFLPINAILNEGPIGIGASGAVFGVFGYIWIRPKVQIGYPVEIPQSNVILMLGFLVACMTPLIQGIANGAHLGGLITGIIVAWLWPKT